MRILWISHEPIRDCLLRKGSTSGFWKEALLDHLSCHTHYQIFVASPGKRLLSAEHHQFTFQIAKGLKFHDLHKKSISDILWIIQSCRPQLIHVHGTEQPYGIIKSFTDIPVVVSLQGFLSLCYPYVTGGISSSVWSQYFTLKEYFKKNSFQDLSNVWKNNASVEQRQIRLNRHFIGRTEFDQKFVNDINPTASYYRGNEMLRPSFYIHKWQICKIKRHRIYASSFMNPLKGFHVLLNAIPHLISAFPDIEIVVPGNLTQRMIHPLFGNGYFRILSGMIHQYDLYRIVSFRGRLNEDEITHILCSSHAFVLSSFIENSSNALGEAQIIGVPSIVSPAGGTSSLVQHRKNGLYFEPGNEESLADQIAILFQDDELANHLSLNAIGFANSFYNRETILQQYSSIYSKIINLEDSFQRQ